MHTPSPAQTLCKAHESYRFIEEYDYYSTLSDKERSYIKASIAFVFEHYSSQYTRVETYTKQYTACTIEYTQKPAPFLLALVPNTISIPPLLSLLLPAQILSIPIFVSFEDATPPSPYTLTALELLGVEDIFLGASEHFLSLYCRESQGSIITSGDYQNPHSIFHYTPPQIYCVNEHAPHIKWLYQDALFLQKQEPPARILTEENAHIFLYPKIVLDSYYTTSYTVQK